MTVTADSLSDSDRMDLWEPRRCACRGSGWVSYERGNPYALEPCGCTDPDDDGEDEPEQPEPFGGAYLDALREESRKNEVRVAHSPSTLLAQHHKPWICLTCGRRFRKERAAETHWRDQHGGQHGQ